jgi:uncharacterized HAD superfamily protein
MPIASRILVDIDSTLYEMLPVLAACSGRLFGVSFHPQDVDDWDYWAKIGLTLPQWLAIIDASHDRAQILANQPAPGSVEAIRRWAGRGAVIHVVSDRKPETFEPTRAWLANIGMPTHVLSLAARLDKLAYVREQGIDLVIDDKPSLISALVAAGVPVATLAYGYNREVIALGTDRVIAAPDWARLAAGIERKFTIGPPRSA